VALTVSARRSRGWQPPKVNVGATELRGGIDNRLKGTLTDRDTLRVPAGAKGRARRGRRVGAG
jgi:hypothetical protein